MWDYWRTWLAEALPLGYVIPFIVILSGAWLLGDHLHTMYIDYKTTGEVSEVITEAPKPRTIAWENVAGNLTELPEEVHTVSQEASRVQRI